MSFFTDIVNDIDSADTSSVPTAAPSPATDAPVAAAVPVVDAFDAAFKLLLVYEGGYDNDPRDSGNWTSGRCGVGECLGTKFGVDTASYADVLRGLSADDRAKMPATVSGLTEDLAGILYRSQYWTKVRCPELPAPVALVVFDSAVNSGCGRAVEWLQAAVGAVVDGGFGSQTMAAVKATITSHGAVALANAVLDERIKFDRSLAAYATYGHGWENRVSDIRSHLATFPATA